MEHSTINDAMSILVTIAVAFCVVSLFVLVNHAFKDDKIQA